MQKILGVGDPDPLGAMMLAYLHGDHSACLEVESTTLEMATMTGEMMFRDFQEMDALERQALALSEGRILDVGAGSGSHSLYLQQQGLEVEAIDISPGAVEVMARRGVVHVRHTDLYSLSSGRYDTILLLMNGLGLCGNLAGLPEMLSHAAGLLADDGQILADSTDLSNLYVETAGELPPDEGAYYGETQFVMRYREIVSSPFPWLYVDFATLQGVAGWCGLHCEQLIALAGDRYLARLYRKQKGSGQG